MKISTYREMMLRVPQFPINAILEDEWEKLKESISISSMDFYQAIGHLTSEDLKTVEPAILHSIWKYFNRARFRATPYGSFAGFGMIKNRVPQQSKNITISNQQILHEFVSWDHLPAIQRTEKIDSDTLIFTNGTFYKVYDSIRYVSFDDGKFQLSDVGATPVIHELLIACSTPVSIKRLRGNPALKAEHFALLPSMIDAQLLLTDRQPNIIGEDFFMRQGLEADGKPKYLIAERKVIKGAANQQTFRHLPNLLKVLATINNDAAKEELNQFINRFLQKFEHRQIPVMVALDPELGIGYGDYAALVSDNELINRFSGRGVENNSVNDDKALKDFLLTSLSQSSDAPMQLESLTGLRELPEPKIANSVGVLCSVIDDKIIIDQIGSITANALAGRFSIAGEDVVTFCRDIAAIEQAANPDVLFFDVAYMAEINVDNINRRQQIYPYQVSILNFDMSREPLTIDDMYLSVVNNELVLHSRRLGKRLIPRLSSAYNYTRSDLPLFRLLCDLQGQGINTNLFINTTNLLPNLKFYPRVQYHNIILSAAKWKINYQEYKKHSSYSLPLPALRNYLHESSLPAFVLSRSGDRTLIFNTSDDKDLEALLFILKKSKEVYLEEAFIPKHSIVTDDLGRPYAHQLLLALVHSQQLYKQIDMPDSAEALSHPVERVFAPGSEWLYYEIYTHQMRSDTLLQGKLLDFLRHHKKDILCWFFIRYNEGGSHIRFRMRLKKVTKVPSFIAAVAGLLKDEITGGVVSDFQLKTYKRETDRYGISRIEKVEHHFNKDSDYVIQLLQKSFPVQARYRLCFELCLRMRDAQLFTAVRFEQLISGNVNSLLKEHRSAASDYKFLNNEYKNFKGQEAGRLTPALKRHLIAYEKSLTNILTDCPPNRRAKLFSDLLHMHINRLFASDQRTHEMVIYYFLYRELLYLQAKAS
jgi:thiopeptide-type bacteriocin biosynthesis protein